MRIGLMGGTLDPTHYAHLLIAEAARVRFSLDRVIWVPAGDPPHKDQDVAPQEHRYAMALLATASNPCFEVSRLELEREGPSYSLYTIRHFREALPGAHLSFIAGADAILEIRTWHRHAEVIRECRFIAVTRPGFDLARLAGALPPGYVEQIDTLEAPAIDISGTQIRARIRAGEPVRYLLPETVEAYIRKHRLYVADAPDA
jgi:nicotinate-nucleotide adenylyltransferase